MITQMGEFKSGEVNGYMNEGRGSRFSLHSVSGVRMEMGFSGASIWCLVAAPEPAIHVTLLPCEACLRPLHPQKSK